jgi:hypothetical protein
MLNLNKKSGVLKIEGDKSGEVYLKDGQLTGAKTETQQGEEALYDLVSMHHGSFDFMISDGDYPNNIKNSTMNVLMEACRIMDEKRHFK